MGETIICEDFCDETGTYSSGRTMVIADPLDRPIDVTPQDETFLYPYLKGKANTIGCIIPAIGGIHDHIHLIISIPPALAIADVVKRLKGSSSHALNHHPDREPNRFSWQEGYGVLTLGRKQLPRAIAYVTNQKHHHQAQSLIPILETTQIA